MSAALSIENLRLGYEGHRGLHIVVDDFSLSLDAGDIGCLLGPSGCGKTTVLRAIAGFEPVRAGRIRLGDVLLSSPEVHLPPERRRVGMMFQEYALFPHLTRRATSPSGCAACRMRAAAQRVAAMLALVGLPDAGERHPHQLSGGQQQRIALARALAPEPALLLLDEPFSNLDGSTRERLTVEVREILKAAGQTAVLVTHNEAEARAMADRIGVMHEGRLTRLEHPVARLGACSGATMSPKPLDDHDMRLLHTMLRVGNLQRSIDFYTQVLGMQLLRTSENPEYKYSLAFVGYEGNPAQAEIELTYNWGTDSYEMGTAYGHIALGVPDAYAACDKIKAAGGNVTREAGPVKGGSTVIAFVTDPDGYKIELIQRAEGAAGGGLR